MAFSFAHTAALFDSATQLVRTQGHVFSDSDKAKFKVIK
jgi:hypothetical protein